MAIIRRARGVLLRLVRRPGVAIAVGVALIIPAIWVMFIAVDAPWWAEGLAMIGGATGTAVLWTGVTGRRPDWVE